MRDNSAWLRDRGTEVSFAGQSCGMRDGWQVCHYLMSCTLELLYTWHMELLLVRSKTSGGFLTDTVSVVWPNAYPLLCSCTRESPVHRPTIYGLSVGSCLSYVIMYTWRLGVLSKSKYVLFTHQQCSPGSNIII